MTDPAQEAFALPETVQSVVEARTNGPLIAAAAQLWIPPDALVVDMTYGLGTFWSVYRPRRLVGHDLKVDGVDFRKLPEADGTVDVAVLDPPHFPQGGRETSTLHTRRLGGGPNVREDDGGYLDRYGLRDAPKTVPGIDALYLAGIAEAFRVLAGGGVLLVKCLDYVSSRRYVQGRHRVVTSAMAVGFVQVDEFVHYRGLGPQEEVEVHEHSRRAHSFLCVFRKPKRPRRARPEPETPWDAALAAAEAFVADRRP